MLFAVCRHLKQGKHEGLEIRNRHLIILLNYAQQPPRVGVRLRVSSNGHYIRPRGAALQVKTALNESRLSLAAFARSRRPLNNPLRWYRFERKKHPQEGSESYVRTMPSSANALRVAIAISRSDY